MDLGTKKNFKGPSKLVRQPLYLNVVDLLFYFTILNRLSLPLEKSS